ncbi:unnamed protein product [Hymenolepis diminuta]|uniref:CARD domain-containing protein n=1 Tax=Hymenolepis diminuta TaxID=6216 RepID=A0A158QC17_HYMDI|nr:unnamed protein product [Hymenolepis diminuta]VUZ46727.1 unnamed protein product [Hymenolepis diminuta]
MTEVLNPLNSRAFDKSSESKSPLNTYRQQTKPNPLKREEILSVLQNLELDGPIVDYMVAHGVISSVSASELMQSKCKHNQKIEKLLDLLDSECDSPPRYSKNAKLVLLTNALRSTGQHALASQLDRGRKIKPAPFVSAKLNDTGYGSDIDLSADPSSPELRRRGQLNLWVQVAAIRLSSASCQQLLVPPSAEPPSPSKDKKRQSPPSEYPKRNTKLDETCDAVKNLLETSNGAYFWIDLKSSFYSPTSTFEVAPKSLSNILTKASQPEMAKPKSKVSALERILFCICCGFSRRPNKSLEKLASPRGSEDCDSTPEVQTQEPLISSDAASQKAPSENLEANRAREQALRLAKLAILDAKSNEFYTALANPLSDALVKFLEQTLGVLVLGARVDSHCPDDCLPESLLQLSSPAAAVSIVATTPEVLGRLNDAVILTPQLNSPSLPPASSLSSALEGIFQRESGFLEKIDVKDIRLSVALQADEVKLAASELEE